MTHPATPSDASDLAFEHSVIARAQRQADESRRRGDALSASVRAAFNDLTEHRDDGCAGPHGTRARGACPQCRVAAGLLAALAAYEAP